MGKERKDRTSPGGEEAGKEEEVSRNDRTGRERGCEKLTAVMKSSVATARRAITFEEQSSESAPALSQFSLAYRSTLRTHLIVRPLVSSDSDGLDGQKRRKRLRNLVVKASGSNLLDVDGVGLLEDGDLVPGDGTEDSDGESRSGEGVSSDEVRRNAEESAEGSDLVWERVQNREEGRVVVSKAKRKRGRRVSRHLPLNSSLRGSINLSFMFSSSPPTL